MAIPLTIHNAEVHTATVQIRTLTVSGRQVTLAVFRQLRDEDLIDDGGAFRGVPWGTVNYHPDKCAAAGEHRHVVWQLGSELRRAWVPKPLDAPPYLIDGPVARRYVALHSEWAAPTTYNRRWHRSGFRGGFAARYPEPNYSGTRVPNGVEFDVAGTAVHVGLPYGSEWLDGDEYQAVMSSDINRLAAELRAQVEARQALGRRRHERWAEVCALPQLFIAV